MKTWLQSGKPWIWLSAAAVSISLISVLGLLLLIGWKGLTYFWPAPVYQWQDTEGNRIIGQVYQRDSVPVDHIVNARERLPQAVYQSGSVERLNIKVANRDLYPLDFVSVLASDLSEPMAPDDVAVIERSHSGIFFGVPVAYLSQQVRYEQDIQAELKKGLAFADTMRTEIERLSAGEVKNLGWQLSQLKLARTKAQLNQALTEEYLESYNRQKQALSTQLTEAEKKLDLLQQRLSEERVLVQDMTGQVTELSLSNLLHVWYPNQMGFDDKLAHWLGKVKVFLLDEPREANSEGGVFPAIFGTVFLVLLMSVIVMPLGVVAAVYLHEYAKPGTLTRMIRIAVINLAGVPSIVYGVFGLGFFVYSIGSSLDALFYSNKLPEPTFGTPGILWSALTLALLTLPVVIVATEEGLSRIPNAVRHGSLALGATQFETIWRIVLPMASPAFITGLILAVARAAGEVAPLMLVGVVKLAPSLTR